MKRPKKINFKDKQFSNFLLAHFIGYAQIIDTGKIVYIAYNTREIANTEFDPSVDVNQLFLIIERIENLEDKQYTVHFEKTTGLHKCTIFKEYDKIIEVSDSAIIEDTDNYNNVEYKYLPKDFNKILWEACAKFAHYYLEDVLKRNIFK